MNCDKYLRFKYSFLRHVTYSYEPSGIIVQCEVASLQFARERPCAE